MSPIPSSLLMNDRVSKTSKSARALKLENFSENGEMQTGDVFSGSEEDDGTLGRSHSRQGTTCCKQKASFYKPVLLGSKNWTDLLWRGHPAWSQ